MKTPSDESLMWGPLTRSRVGKSPVDRDSPQMCVLGCVSLFPGHLPRVMLHATPLLCRRFQRVSWRSRSAPHAVPMHQELRVFP